MPFDPTLGFSAGQHLSVAGLKAEHLTWFGRQLPPKPTEIMGKPLSHVLFIFPALSIYNFTP